MRPMRRPEGIVHIDFSRTCQLLRKSCVVGFLFRVKAQIFELQNIPGLQYTGSLLDFVADAIIDERHVAPEHVRQLLRHGTQRHRRFTFPLWAPQMRRQNDLRSPLHQQVQGGQRLLDACHIRDHHLALFFLHRDVIIHAHKHPSAAHIYVSHRRLRHIKGPENSPAALGFKALMALGEERLERQAKILRNLDEMIEGQTTFTI